MPIAVPSGVEITIAGQSVSVKGPKGSLSLNVAEPIQVSQTEGVITVARPNEERLTRSLHGLSRTLVANMVEGVTNGYTTTIEIVGVGYRVAERVQTSSSNSDTATTLTSQHQLESHSKLRHQLSSRSSESISKKLAK